MSDVTTIGIDLAKNVFQVHGVDKHGKVVFRKQLRRKQMAKCFANLPTCLIGMEACGSAHFWARKLESFGHTVRLMAPQFVKPYVKTNKHDVADAEAICEAVTRPNMRFVAVKTPEQQSVLALHRAREGFMKDRTAYSNRIRGLLGEWGIVLPKGINGIHKGLPYVLEDADNQLSDNFRDVLARLGEHLKIVDQQVQALEKQINKWHRRNAVSCRLAEIPGIGPLTATALVATIGNAHHFQNGRQLAAFLGLVPKQHSSGGKQKLLGISKRGDSYLRTLLVHGARAVVRIAPSKPDTYPWITQMLARRPANITVVALANKNARIVWALMVTDQHYMPRLTHG